MSKRISRSWSVWFICGWAGVVPSPLGTAGEAICPVLADNSIASYEGDKDNPNEHDENTGSAKTNKIKRRENQVLLKFDLSAIPKDATVTKALLSVKVATPDHRLNQIGFSTMPTDWIEGTEAKAGGGRHDFSCYRSPGPRDKSWGDPGTDFQDTTFGLGGNVTGVTLARPNGDRFEIDLPGRVLEALRADQPGGLLLMDETGWWGKRCNIYIFSREAGADGPRLSVTWSETKDAVPPSSPALKALTGALDDGEMLLEITCGGDDGAVGTALGFDLRMRKDGILDRAQWDQGTPLPRYRVPRPIAAGEKLRLWLRGLAPGASYGVGLVAYDEAGNRSEGAFLETKAIGPTPAPKLELAESKFETGGPLPVGEGMRVWAAGELTRIDPLSGKTLDGPGYADHKAREGNEVWNGKTHAVTLEGARGEFVCFRLAVETSGKPVTGITLTPGAFKGPDGAAIEARHIRLLREWYLKDGNQWYGGALPELGEKDGGKFDVPAKDNLIPAQTVQCIFVEVFVPKDAKPGAYAGALELAADGPVKGSVPLYLQVHAATLPDELNYLIELNAYGQDLKEPFYAIHRLAHRFRLGYNVLSYGHSRSGALPCIPKIKGAGAAAAIASWSAWDDWMGPLLDGSLFKDLPRAGTPISHFYLPFYESYPTSIFEHYGDGTFHKDRHLKPGEKWDREEWLYYISAHDGLVADMFSAAWKQAAAKIAGEYRAHFEEKGWTRTEFQIFSNNKHYFRKTAGSTVTSLWTLDEPSYGRDFRALGFLYGTFKKPFEGTSLKVVTRGDISRPEMSGDRLAGVLDLSVSGSSGGWQTLRRRRELEDGTRFWFYGGRGSPTDDSAQLAAVYIKNWTLGCIGGLAHWTSFQGNHWDDSEPLSVVLSPNHGYTSLAVATDRLVTCRRAQQDLELFHLLAQKPGWSRRRVEQAVAAAVNLASTTVQAGADDPGVTRFHGIRAQDLARIRGAVLRMLEE